jgi:SRSO17 transposase
MPIERKSVEPMAAVTAPAGVAAKHQSLLHFVGNAPWSDAAMLAKVGELVLPGIERSGPVEAWIIDDTGFPKKGRHSVGVTRQYCSLPKPASELVSTPWPQIGRPRCVRRCSGNCKRST